MTLCLATAAQQSDAARTRVAAFSQMVLAYWHMRKAHEEESHCEAAASFYQVGVLALA